MAYSRDPWVIKSRSEIIVDMVLRHSTCFTVMILLARYWGKSSRIFFMSSRFIAALVCGRRGCEGGSGPLPALTAP